MEFNFKFRITNGKLIAVLVYVLLGLSCMPQSDTAWHHPPKRVWMS